MGTRRAGRWAALLIGGVVALDAAAVHGERGQATGNTSSTAPAAPGPRGDDDAALASEADRLGIRRAIERGQGRLVPRQARRLAAAVVREARRRGLDPRLVAAVAIVESQFDPFAVSDQGALGVMQLMPATARELSKSPGAAVPALRERDLFDFERNLELGAAYLAGLVRQFPCLDLALWAYNAGPTAARRLSLSGQAAPPGSYPHRVRLEYRKLAGAEAEAALPAACALPPAAQGG